MRKIKLIKVVVPKVVAYVINGEDIKNTENDYRCPVCGMGISEEYKCCPYCMSEFDWDKVKQPTSEEIRKMLDQFRNWKNHVELN